MKKISIVTVHWWAKNFLEVLINSVMRTTINDFEIIVVDNSNDLDWKEDLNCNAKVTVVKPAENIGHGGGIDKGIRQANGEYIMLLDVDSHIIMEDWDSKMLGMMCDNPDIKMACAVDGGLLKPARPLAMFFKRSTIVDNNISFKPREFDGVKFDVGLHAYFKILTLFGDKSIWKLHAKKTEFQEVLGNEYTLNGERFVYHNWYGTRWYDDKGRARYKKIDKVTYRDYLTKKNNLFKQL